MQDRYRYLNALKLAARAGDAESHWLLAEYYQDQTSRSRYDYSASQGAFDNLSAAARSRHPLAQRALGRFLVLGSAIYPAQPLKGLRLWLSGCLGTSKYRPMPLPDRLLALAPSQILQKEAFLSDSGRVKFLYQFDDEKKGFCNLRIHYKGKEGCTILLEQPSRPTGNSVTNVCEYVATSVVYSMLLSGIDLNPETVVWYEAYPAQPFDKFNPLSKVDLNWDGTFYSSPKWRGVGIANVPFDLTDILVIKNG